MLFDFTISTHDQAASPYRSVLRAIHASRVYILVALLGFLMAIFGYFYAGLALSVCCIVSYYIYLIWQDLSTLSFDTHIGSIDLQDIINDLEGGR